jgi:hypothetical protein
MEVPSRVIVTPIERSGACNLKRHYTSQTTSYTSFTMPPSLHLVAQHTPRVIRIVATHAYVWVRPILIVIRPLPASMTH